MENIQPDLTTADLIELMKESTNPLEWNMGIPLESAISGDAYQAEALIQDATI